MPPISCDRAVLALRMRPAANTPSMRRRRTSPVVGVDADLGEVRAVGCTARTSCTSSPGSDLGRSACRSPRRPRPASSLAFELRVQASCSARRRSSAAPNEPPEPGVGGIVELSPSSTAHALERHAERLGGDLGQDRCRCRCRCRSCPLDRDAPSRVASRTLALAGAQEVAADRGRHADSRPATGRRAAGRARAVARVPAEPPRAFAHALDQRARSRTARPFSGWLVGLVADAQLDRVHAELRRPARPSPTRAPACPTPRPARAWPRPRGRSSATSAVAWSAGWARHRAARAAAASARRTRRAGAAAPATSWRDRDQPCRRASAPSRTRWIGRRRDAR